MSRANIISIDPVTEGLVPVGVNVTFSVHGADGSRTYYYDGADAAIAIMGGADPADFDGVRDGAPSGIAEEIESAIDIAELGGLL